MRCLWTCQHAVLRQRAGLGGVGRAKTRRARRAGLCCALQGRSLPRLRSLSWDPGTARHCVAGHGSNRGLIYGACTYTDGVGLGSLREGQNRGLAWCSWRGMAAMAGRRRGQAAVSRLTHAAGRGGPLAVLHYSQLIKQAQVVRLQAGNPPPPWPSRPPAGWPPLWIATTRPSRREREIESARAESEINVKRKSENLAARRAAEMDGGATRERGRNVE